MVLGTVTTLFLALGLSFVIFRAGTPGPDVEVASAVPTRTVTVTQPVTGPSRSPAGRSARSR
jgi:hypothetical protein